MQIQRKTSAVIILVVVFVGFTAFSFNTIYHNLAQGTTDFYPTWKAAELFLRDGISPYDKQIGEESQKTIYGRPAKPQEDQFLYFYPFYVMLYFTPVGMIDYQLAAAIYVQLLLFALLLSLGLTLRVLRWLPSPLMLAALIVFTVTSYFSARGLLLAQHAILAYAMHIIALWGIFTKRDQLAGLALALSTMKPQTGFLIIPLLLAWAWRFGRREMVYSFGLAFGLMCGVSFVLQPNWLVDWIGQIRAYESTTETLPALYVITHPFGILPGWLAAGFQIFLTVLFAIPVLIFWKQLLVDKDQHELPWGVLLTLTYSLMIAPRTATTYYVELYPALYITAMLMTRRGKTQNLYLSGAVLLVGYWLLHIFTIPEDPNGSTGLEAPVVYAVLPLLVWGLLFYFRNQYPKYHDLLREREALS